MKIKIIRFAGAIALSITLAGCAPRPSVPEGGFVPKEPVFEHNKGSFTDQRDGKTYETVVIGTQTWMAENLNYEAEGSKCYDGNESNCQKYGKLYNWLTATGPGLPSDCNSLLNNKVDCTMGVTLQGICPAGWHLPSDAEWQTLVDFAGGKKSAGTRLKASSDWKIYHGSDSYGFAALPSGSAHGDRFLNIGSAGSWWTSTGGGNAPGLGVVSYEWSMTNNGHFYYKAEHSMTGISSFYSVRCVQN